MAKAVVEGGNSKKKLSKDDAKLAGVVQRIGAIDKKPMVKKDVKAAVKADVKAVKSTVKAVKAVKKKGM
jgi:hypothetical protein